MTKNMACGLITLGLAVAYLFAAAALPTSALADAVGSAGFPMLIGWALAGVSVLLIARSALPLLSRQKDADTAETDQGIWATPLRTSLRAGGLVAIAAAFLLLLPVVGYIVSLFLMIGAVAVYYGAAPSWRTALVAAGGGVLFWLLFVIVLDIPLPPGFWARLL